MQLATTATTNRLAIREPCFIRRCVPPALLRLGNCNPYSCLLGSFKFTPNPESLKHKLKNVLLQKRIILNEPSSCCMWFYFVKKYDTDLDKYVTMVVW